MSHNLFRTKKELNRALEKDMRDMRTLQDQGYDTSGIRKVISNKKRILNDKDYWK